jgi:hypothetical protein
MFDSSTLSLSLFLSLLERGESLVEYKKKTLFLSPVRLLSSTFSSLFSPFWQPTIFTLMDEKTTAYGEEGH